MTEVCIHFKNILVCVFQCPFKSSNVGSTQSQFSFTFYHEKLFGKFLLQFSYDGCRSVRRAVFYDQNMEYLGKAENGTDDIFYVLPFIIGGDNYNAIRCLHIDTIKFKTKVVLFL